MIVFDCEVIPPLITALNHFVIFVGKACRYSQIFFVLSLITSISGMGEITTTPSRLRFRSFSGVRVMCVVQI